MGDIGDKLLLACRNLRLILYIRLQLVVGGLQIRDGALEPIGHDIHRVSEHSDLVTVTAGIASREIQPRHAFTEAGELVDWLRDLTAHEVDDDRTDQDGADSDEKQEAIKEAH